ncbi:MAG: hypothetical protein ABSB74_19210 [Tepidisphaeraceae bacterium]
MKFTSVFLTVAGVALLQTSIAAAVAITYVFDGTASGTLGAKAFSDASMSVTAVTDTTDVPAPTGADNIIDVYPSLVTINIGGLGSTTISNGYLFDNQALESGGFGARPGSDTIQIPDPSFGPWNMKTAFGPVFAASDRSIADWTGMSTSKGDLAVNSYTNLTFTATLGGSGNSPAVPAPSAAGLSLAGLSLCLIAAYRRRVWA